MRKPIGFLILLLWLAGYVMLAVTIGSSMTTWPQVAQLIYYVIAGIAWIIPLKPLFGWMNKGEDFGLDAED